MTSPAPPPPPSGGVPAPRPSGPAGPDRTATSTAGGPATAGTANPGAILLIVAGVVSVLCWLGPWFTFSFGGLSSASVGRDEYGVLWALLVVGLVVIGLAAGFVHRPAPQGVGIPAIVAAGLLVLVYVVQALDWLADYTDDIVGDFADPGWAAIISPIIPVTAALGAILLRRARPAGDGPAAQGAVGWGSPAVTPPPESWGAPGSPPAPSARAPSPPAPSPPAPSPQAPSPPPPPATR